MRISRRLLLLYGLAAPLLLRVRAVFGLPEQRSKVAARGTIDEATLGAWLDTLLPPDSESPGATDLGIHTILPQMAQSNSQVTMLLTQGLAWLDQQAAKHESSSFKIAPGKLRDAIAAEAEAGAEDSPQRQFFVYTLNRVYEFYYTNPRSWSALNYRGPPQPGGYLDFTKPPVGAGHGG